MKYKNVNKEDLEERIENILYNIKMDTENKKLKVQLDKYIQIYHDLVGKPYISKKYREGYNYGQVN